MPQLEAAARAATITILCRTPDAGPKEQKLASHGFRTLFVNKDYWVLDNAAAADR
jgi:hypothetical protein